jgi:glycine cleavage system H protein
MGPGNRKREDVRYRRARFSARFPDDRRYTASHFWLAEQEPGLWRVGFTPFALRMLGQLVEHGFELAAGDPVALGQPIGWIEGFKARTDLYAVASGEYGGSNPGLAEMLGELSLDPYQGGWLYAVRGEPDPDSVDVRGYVTMLDATIDRLQAKSREER